MCVCVCRIFNLGYLDEAEKVYINWDGAGDNVNYTVVYALIHFLLCAEAQGWPLRTFVILRLPVGHTHVLLDSAWSLLSRLIYGIRSRGDARRDVLDWNQLQKCCELVYGDRLLAFEHIQGCFDFKTFVKPYRPATTDTGTSQHAPAMSELG